MKPAEYWAGRSERIILNAERQGAELIKTLSGFYAEADRQIQREVEAFFGRYASSEGIALDEAKKRLTSGELKRFNEELRRYHTEAQRLGLNSGYVQHLRTLSARAYVSRQMELLAQIRHQVETLMGQTLPAMTGTLAGVYNESYYREIFYMQQGLGFGTDFARMDTGTVEAILRKPWLGDNFSSRLWQNKEQLLRQMEQIIPRAFAAGENSRVLGQQLAKRLNVSQSAGERLVRTEVSHAANQASLRAYKEMGVEEYEYLATLDNRTSEICASLDGKVFRVTDASTGVNFPPSHPHCRSTTVPYFAPDEFDDPASRAARDADGKYYTVPASMTYAEWKKLTDRGIIKSKGGMPMRVTDESIEKVPAIKSAFIGPKHEEQLRSAHQDLLRYIRGDVPGTEAIAYYTKDFVQLARYKGDSGANAVFPTNFSTPHFLMHNHPDGGTFSPNDFYGFIKNGNTGLMTAVGNDGSLYYLEKTQYYNASAALRKYIGLVDEIKESSLDWESVNRLMEGFLESLTEDGFIYGRG